MIKILLVDEYAERAALLASSLEASGYEGVVRANTSDDICARVKGEQPDVVLIDIDVPDQCTLEHIAAIQRHSPRPIVLFTQQDDKRIIDESIRAGATAYIVDGISASSVRPIIDAAIATFGEFQMLARELEKTRNSLSDRKVIDRAKGILMSRKKISEEKAYKSLQKMAMDSKRKLSAVAQDVVSMAGLLAVDDDRCTEAK